MNHSTKTTDIRRGLCGEEETMRSFKIFSVLLLTIGLVGVFGGNSSLLADESDPPHVTHLTAARGPGITDCADCHTGTPAYDNEDTGACDTCHSPGGVWDGVDDVDVGALNNWDNMDLCIGRQTEIRKRQVVRHLP